MSVALIARADEGGIAIQTLEIARHVPFERILVVDVEPPRGVYRPGRYAGLAPEVRYGPNDPPRRNQLGVEDIEWLCECDRVVFVEDCYSHALPERAAETGTRLVVIANPELFTEYHRDWARREILEVLAPTEWERHRLGAHRLLRMPVATDRFDARVRDREPRTFLHVSAPAMLDRNGTTLVRSLASTYTGPPIRVFVAGPERPGAPDAKPWRSSPNVKVVPVGDVRDYWERYTSEIDALLSPRRYGGLSLIAQEAAAAGLPVVCLDRHPESTWAGTVRIPVSRRDDHKMKGGRFHIAYAEPHRLAEALASLATSDPTGLSRAALAYARSISWETLRDEWTATLRGKGDA